MNSQIQWYVQGAEDGAAYNKDELFNSFQNPVSDGSNSAFGPSFFLNLGTGYSIKHNLKASFFVYNVLGLIDKDLNGRSEYRQTSQYRVEPVSFSLKVKYVL